MAIFGIITDIDPIVSSFITETDRRLQDSNVVRNPFRGGVKSIIIHEDDTDKLMSIVHMTPIYLNLSIIGWVTMLGLFVFMGFTLWMIPALIIGLSGLFWRREFFFHMLKKGLKKKGYEGGIKLIDSSKVLENIYFKEVE